MIKKIYYINIALFVVVVGMVSLLLTEQYTIPPEPSIKAAQGPVESKTIEKASTGVDTYVHLGKAPIFDTIIPKPTPVPTPVPTKPPDPELDKAIAGWKLNGVLPGGMALFEDKRTKEEWQMNVGEVRAVKYGKWTLDAKLESVDETKFTVTIIYQGEQGKQSKTLSMFE